MRHTIIGLLLLILCQGCIPVLIGGAFYSSAKTTKARQEFIANFNETNIEREKAGLKPLDICEAKYNFDPEWAKQNPVCQDKLLKEKKIEKEVSDEDDFS